MSDEVNLENLDALADLPDSAGETAAQPIAADHEHTTVEADTTDSVDAVSEDVSQDETAVNAGSVADNGSEDTDSASAAPAAADQDEDQDDEETDLSDQAEGTDAGQQAVNEFAKSLRTLEGKWYVLHTYSGYEKRVKTNVESRAASFGLEDKIFQVEVPMEEVEKHTDKGKKVISRVRVPGYVLIRMWPDEDARRIVRETEGVTGFVGPTKDPAPLSRKEVVSMMAPMIASEALKKAGDKLSAVKKRTIEVSYAICDQVTVTEGPFATMAALFSDVELTTQKLTVLVSIFGRDTPVELGFNQVQKLN